TIILAICACYGGVTFIVFAILIFRLLPYLFSMYPPFTSTTSNFYKITIALLVAINVLLLCYANYHRIVCFFKKILGRAMNLRRNLLRERKSLRLNSFFINLGFLVI